MTVEPCVAHLKAGTEPVMMTVNARNGSKIHAAFDMLGNLLALHVTPANEQDRQQVKKLSEMIQKMTHDSIEIVFVDQGYLGKQAEGNAVLYDIRLDVVRLPGAKKNFVLLPRR